MHDLSYSILLLYLGWLLRGALQGRWRSNPKRHHAADPRHCWVEIAGRWHAFTDDALDTALARADMLAPWFRHHALRWTAHTLAVAALVAGVLFTA
jgi:hypothetical protein